MSAGLNLRGRCETTHLSRGILWEKSLQFSFKPETALQWWLRKTSDKVSRREDQPKKINPLNNDANKSAVVAANG